MSKYVTVQFSLTSRPAGLDETTFNRSFLWSTGALDEAIETQRQLCVNQLTGMIRTAFEAKRRRVGPGHLVLDLALASPELLRQAVEDNLVVGEVRMVDNLQATS